MAYRGLDRDAEAVEAYKEAIRLEPDNASAHFGLGLTHLMSGNRGAALDEYRTLRKLDRELAESLFKFIYP